MQGLGKVADSILHECVNNYNFCVLNYNLCVEIDNLLYKLVMRSINIAICDDSKIESDSVATFVQEILDSKLIKYDLQCFDSLESLKEALALTAFQILLLDVRFENTNSIPFAKRMSDIYPHMQIIFITNYPEFFPDVYLCQHVYCIQKSDLHLRLPDAFNKALANINSRSNRITVTSNYNTYILDTSQIIYLEKNLRKVDYVYRKDLSKSMTPDNVLRIETYGKFSEILPQLPDNFIQTHQSYAINMNYIQSIKNNQVILMTGEEILISRKFKKNLLDQLKHFIFD